MDAWIQKPVRRLRVRLCGHVLWASKMRV
jgi:hypothetical protein